MLARRGYLLLFLAILFFYFYGLGSLPLLGADEPRYAEVAREMLLRRDLITPTLGGHTWFEKPALLYWLMMASFSAFGVSEWTARLGPAACGVLTIASVYLLGKWVEIATLDQKPDGLGCRSSAIAASTAGILVFSRGASFDIVLTMTVTWALTFFFIAELHRSAKNRLLLLAGFYVFVGLSILAKGLVGLVVPFGVIGLYYTLRKELPAHRVLFTLVWGVPLTIAVAAIWYAPIIERHGWYFVNDFFVQHHFVRYITDKYHHRQPFYYYLIALIPMSLPWTVLLIDGLFNARTWRLRAPAPEVELRVFALAWLLLPLIFFSFSKSKLPGYILPILPPAALICGERLNSTRSPDNRNGVIKLTGVLLILLAALGFIYARQTGNVSVRCVITIVGPLVLAGLLALFRVRTKDSFVRLVVCAVLLSSAVALNCNLERVSQRESARDLIQLADARGYASAPIYALHRIDRSAEFYAAGRVVYDAIGEPVRFESAPQLLVIAQQLHKPILVIVPLEYVYQLTGLKAVQTEVIRDNGEIAIVVLRAQ